MLRAGLIGFPSTGKTTLFELLSRKSGTPAKPRSGKNETNTGTADVPDNRLDRLNALFSPEKNVPATVVFSDILGASNPQNLIDVAPYREANALLHVVRAFRAGEVPHVAGTIDPYRDARTMEDELILADLAVTERRLERIKKTKRKVRPKP